MREISRARDLLEAFGRLRAGAYPWLLDSALISDCGRFSFAGADPYLVARGRGATLELECLRAARPGLEVGRREVAGDPLEIARALMP
ncbi:MAG TPA: hypothetical protein VEC18_03970, partial [Myxococcota bacterium]|nr:hypothetical protein [Myxococcota bacterium]